MPSGGGQLEVAGSIPAIETMSNRKPAKSAPPPAPPDDQSVFTVKQLVARWHTHRFTIIKAINDGRLKAFRPGERVYRVTRAEVERFEAESAGELHAEARSA